MVKKIYESKERMQRPIDMLQLHWPPTLGWQQKEYLDAFQQTVDDRWAKQVGMSNFGPVGLRKVHFDLLDRGIQVHSNQVRSFIDCCFSSLMLVILIFQYNLLHAGTILTVESKSAHLWPYRCVR